MLSALEKEMLNKLIDKYEGSKSFLGQNKVRQSFTLTIEKEFPKYVDHSEFELFEKINEAIQHLEKKQFIYAKQERNGSYLKIELREENILDLYQALGRLPKKDTNEALKKILLIYKQSDHAVLSKYAQQQLENIELNKNVKYFDGNMNEFNKLLQVVEAIFKVEQEIYIRDFSIRFFKDSKEFEKMEGKIVSLIYEYGDFPEKESLLEELNIIKTPTYVSVKGNGILSIGDQKIDLSRLSGDIALSSITLSEVSKVEVLGSKVVTVENLTSFHTFQDEDALVIYLGGFHNTVRRKFLKQIYKNNHNVQYLHFGDIDAGGFYIYEHLKKMTGIPFKTLNMNVDTLEKYKEYWKSLTKNDSQRLSKLLGLGNDDVVQFMLAHHCKLEQEIIE